MIMKKREMLDLNLILTQLKEFGNTKFKYAILKNIGILKAQLIALEQIESEVKEILKDFEADRNNLIVELGTSDNAGNYTVDQTDEEVMQLFKEKLETLIEKHKPSIDEYNKKLIEFENLLSEESDEELYFKTISIEDLPDEGLSADQLLKLLEAGIIE